MQKYDRLTQETKTTVSETALITISEGISTGTTYIALELDGYIADPAGG